MKIDIPPNNDDTQTKDSTKNTEQKNNEQFIKIPLSEKERSLSVNDLAKKLNLSWGWAQSIKERGYRMEPNQNFKSRNKMNLDRLEKDREYFMEVTPVQIESIETCIGNEKEQAEIKKILEIYNKYKYSKNTVEKKLFDDKKFRLLNGQELHFGDFIILNKFITSRAHRDMNGNLLVFDSQKNIFVPFTPSKFFSPSKQGFYFENINSPRKNLITLESFAPGIFSSGLFDKDDFNVNRLSGGKPYEVLGAHERTISPTKPQVFFSNEDGAAHYYIGRNKFVDTDQKINHKDTRIILLDNKTAGIVEEVHGKRKILYTFPLIDKDTYKRKKQEVIDKRMISDKPTDDIYIKNFITTTPILESYSITKLFHKNYGETDEEYAERISRYSDTSYILNNFRFFMSETGLAASNYSWKEQLVLSDSLTNVKNKEELISFSKRFGKNGLKTFLSIEQGGKEMGDKILKLGGKLPEDISGKVFEKYGEIIDSVDKVEEEIKNIYKNEEIPINIYGSIKEILLKEGAQLLIRSANEVNKGQEIDEGKILQDLEDIKTNTIILGSSYVELYREGIKVPIEEITKIEKISSGDLTDKEKKELLKVYENGRPKNTYENPGHLKLLTEEFKEELENKSTEIINIRFNGDIIIFAVTDKKSNDDLYIGGLTFVNDVRNPIIAVSAMESILKEYKNNNIKALVDSKNPILPMYLKRFGFKIIRELPKEENAGELYYEIEKQKESKEERIKLKEAA